ncbi:MAG: hypothetical protein IJ124_01850 [Clostridia bacterium]|nr:hypothetical protein [Clostridia bacterium]
MLLTGAALLTGLLFVAALTGGNETQTPEAVSLSRGSGFYDEAFIWKCRLYWRAWTTAGSLTHGSMCREFTAGRSD